MNKILEFVKEHPYGTAIGIFVVGGAIIILSSKGNSSSPAATNDAQSASNYNQIQASEVASNNSLVESQNQLQAATTASNNAFMANGQTIAGQVQIATLNSQTQQNSDTLQATVASLIATLQEKATEVTSTLSAQVASTNSNNSLAAVINNNATASAINQQNVNEVLGVVSILNPPKNPPPAIDPQENLVNSLYVTDLGRGVGADTDAEYWVQALKSGALNLTQVEAGIANSPEGLKYAAAGGH